MEISLPWESNSCSTTEKISSILWNLRFITILTVAPYWSLCWVRWIQSLHSHSFSLRLILIISHVCLGLSSRHSTCLTPLILFDMITPIVLGGEHKLRSSLLHSFLEPYITSSLLGLYILLNTLFPDTLSVLSPSCERPSFTHMQNSRQNYSFLFNFHVFRS